jgi:hypothetical protein
MTGVEDPVIGIAAEDRRNLFLGGKLQKGGLVEACPNDRGAAVVLTSTVRGAFCWTVAGGAAWALTANRTLAAMSREVFIGRLQ